MILTAVAHRPRDTLDARSLLETNPNADVELVRRWVRESGFATAMSDLIEDFDKAIARSQESR